MNLAQSPYKDIGLCLECAYQHSRDVEHHLEDAVKFGKSSPDRAKYQELLDKQRLIRKEIDKLRLKTVKEKGEEICIACENPELEVYVPPPELGEFWEEKIRPKEYFDPRSFRVICPEDPENGFRGRCERIKRKYPELYPYATRVVIGCKKGEFIAGRCRIGTETHVIYHTKHPEKKEEIKRKLRIKKKGEI